MDSEQIDQLIRIASDHKLVQFRYLKKATRHDAPLRVVEAYNFSQGRQDPMIRCYQIEPQEGWRFFMLHKIEGVSDTGVAFRPRRKVTLCTGLIDDRVESSSNWPDIRRGYRNLISDSLADGTLSKSELVDINDYVLANGLREQDIRFVHASIYHRCLGAILDDGIVGDDEEKQIRFLDRALSYIGWSPSSAGLKSSASHG